MLSQGAFAVSVLDSVPAGGSPRADFIISGHLSSSSEGITATVRMDETAHHFVVFSHQFEANSKETSGFPERVGAQVAAQLSWTAPALVVERRHPSDPAVTAAVLQTSSTGLSGGGNLHDYETTRRLAMRAPDSPLAQEAFAVNTAFALDQLPREQRAQAVAEARRAADRTTMLAPDYAGGSIAWCLLQNNVHLIECEDRLRAGMRADPDSAFAGWFLSADLNEVGRNRESLDLAKLSLAHDQYMLFKIARALLMLEEAGRTQEAAKLYQRSAQWWPNNPAIFGYQFTGILERGDFRALQKFNEEGGDRSKAAPILAAINSGSIAQVRASCSAGNASTNALCILALARVGDLDTAFDLAKRVYPSRLGHSTTDADRIWLDNPDEELLAFITSPAAAPLRRDPRYFALAERTGLVAYWRSGRLPDFCQPPNPEPICIQLLKR
jgi:tetratricopeptide (TPR) repeat protein